MRSSRLASLAADLTEVRYGTGGIMRGPGLPLMIAFAARGLSARCSTELPDGTGPQGLARRGGMGA